MFAEVAINIKQNESFVENYFKTSLTASLGTICSWNVYAPVLGDFTILMTLLNVRPSPFWSEATVFFAIV